MKVQDIATMLENAFPPALQESYDNTGMQLGLPDMEVSGILICLDVTEAVIDDAIATKCNLIVSHHPLLFKGIKSITGKNYIERCILKACKNEIAIYAAHTNADNALHGVNFKIAEKIGLINVSILREQLGLLEKLVVFAPIHYADTIRKAIFDAGAGTIGNYDTCSFNVAGYGTFRAGIDAHPFCGQPCETHVENEIRIEAIFPVFNRTKIMNAIRQTHPYEEPAFDFYPLHNSWTQAGAGIIGELPAAMDETEFLSKIKTLFNIPVIKHSPFTQKKVKKVALCGGSGAFLLQDALDKQADVFLTGEIKYHDFLSTENKILIAEIGHFESEQYTKEIFYDCIRKKIINFAVQFSSVETNPVNYF
jgi:dinuclear metal center YbgI/SA1388 family protein